MSDASRLSVVRSFVAAARRLVDLGDALGRRAIQSLPASSGLSEAGVRYALTRCLELDPTLEDLEKLCASVPLAAKAHVSLAANVFTAPLRAIALALASAPRVDVRPSRREPIFTELLHEASAGEFDLVTNLAPRAGEQVFAYGSDETLSELRRMLPAGVVFHGHGAGIGIAVVDETGLDGEPDLALRLALDTAAFDQRGCLSPRLVLVAADTPRARAFAVDVGRKLALIERKIPRGTLSTDDRAEILRYRATMTYLAEVIEAETSTVVFDDEARRLPIAPTSRNLSIVKTNAPHEFIDPIRPAIAAVGLACGPELEARVKQAVPRARISPVGQMQTPALDGPVDLRTRARVL